jgi:hypothetical protein
MKAGCCWPANQPESTELIDQVISPMTTLQKISKIKDKLKSSNFLQTSTEDFLSSQNLDRKCSLQIL